MIPYPPAAGVPASSSTSAEANVGASPVGDGFCVVDERFAQQLLTTHERWFEHRRDAKDEFTREIPNVGEEGLMHLDEPGVARLGTMMTPGMILIGRITQRNEGALLSPEEKLLRAIFGEKAGDVVDSSLRIPPGVFGEVASVEAGADVTRVRLTWLRPLEVGDVLELDSGKFAVVSEVKALPGIDLVWSGGTSKVRVRKHALARDVMHARHIGPYDLVTQQPLRAKESWGGQVASEELLESLATAAPWLAFELLTLRSDAVLERTRAYESLVKQSNPGGEYLEPPKEQGPEAPPPAPAASTGGMKDIFSFFERPKERGAAAGEIIHLLGAWLRALALEVDFSKRNPAVARSTPDSIRKYATGEVRNAAELDSQKIFGPRLDYKCECGKYTRMKDRGVVCETCGVEVIQSRVRRTRFGFFQLAAPVRHPLDPSWELTVLPVLPPDLRPSEFYTLTAEYGRVLEARTASEAQSAVNVLFKSLVERANERWRTRTFSKAVDYSGLAHLTVDPTLSPGTCRLPRAMANELFRAWAYGVLEAKGYVTTIKSAKKMLEKERPEALRSIEAACTGWPLVIASQTQVVARTIQVWDSPAVAVDEATAQLLAAHSVQVFVPVTTQAVLECMPFGAGGAAGLKPLECRINSAKTSTVGWLSGARIDGDLVQAALKSTEPDPLDDAFVRLALGWWPPAQDAAVLKQWEDARREFEQGYATSTQEGAALVEQQVSSHLERSVDELEVSVATYNAFQRLGLKTIGELVQKTEAELLEAEGFGRRSLKEVKEILADMGLTLGMKL